MSLRTDLEQVVRGEVLTDRANLERASTDASIFRIRPKAVVAPRDVADLQSLVRFVANSQKELQLSLTVRAAGTDMTGGPLGSSIVLDVGQHLTGIHSITTHSIHVLAGTPFCDIESALARHHLFYPAYPASKEHATIGGMVANNAGGELSLRYGQTDQYVRALTAITADGSQLTFRRLKGSDLISKLHQPGFEGDLYRTVVPLLRDNWPTITDAKPTVTKNASGYLLWNAYNPSDESVDLGQLFVGSQGTLGILTKIELNVLPRPPYQDMVVVTLENLVQLGPLIETLRSLGATALELLDQTTLNLAASLVARLGIDHHHLPLFLLLTQFTGHQSVSVDNTATKATQAISQLGLQWHRVTSLQEAKEYWNIRRASFEALRQASPDQRAAAFIDDVIVPPRRLTEFLTQLTLILARYPKLKYSIVGHAGDGNLHLIPLLNLHSNFDRELITTLADQVYALTLSLGGSLSAEHNDGLIRGPYLDRMYSPKIIELFHQIKHAFDPKGIFNPHKKIDATWAYSQQHIRQR